MKKLFISYAHLDSEIVLDISGQLQVAGYDVWIDKFGIQGGDLWGSEIVKGISDCDIFLLFISSKSIVSDYVRRELDIAFSEKRPILPIRIEAVNVPQGWRYQLAGLQYISYQQPDWRSRLFQALGKESALSERATRDTGKLRNPYSSLPVLEPVERTLILSNRAKELDRAVEQLKIHRLLLVTGMPGIGKSTFARALLEFIPPGTPPPFWYNFERQRSSGNSLGFLLDSLSGYLDVVLDADVRREVMAFRDPPGRNPSVQDVDVLISYLNQDVPIWLVFDNLETVLSRDTYEFLDEGLELLFDSLKVNSHKAKVIITNPFIPILKTGEVFIESGTSALSLGGLNDDFTVAFLHAFGLQERSKADLEPLIREINGYPFVLNYVARYMQAMGSQAILENLTGGLEEINERFGDFLKGRLSAQEFKALQALTVLNRDMALAGLCQIAQVRANVIMRLREKGLLQANESGKFWLHNIIRSSMRPSEPAFIHQAHVRAMNYYRGQERPLSMQILEDYAGVLEWHYHATEAQDVVNAYSALYSTGLHERLMKWNEYELLARLCERTLAAGYQIEANVSQIEVNLSDPERINLYHTLGIAYFLLGEFAKSTAPLERAVNLLSSQQGNELRIKLLIDLAECYNGMGNVRSAMDLCEQLVVLLSEQKNDALQAKFLHVRGIVYRDSKNPKAAKADLEQAIHLYDSLNDILHLANARIDLGNVYYDQNEFTEAIENYRLALSSFESQRDARGILISRFNIADILLQQEQYQAALEAIRPAVEIARKRRNVTNLELKSGLLLIEAQIALGLLDEAEEELHRIREPIRKYSSACLIGQELVLQAFRYSKKNQPEAAMSCFGRAFEILEAPGCREECAHGYLLFAVFMKDQSDLKRAREYISKARDLFVQMNNQLGLQTTERMSSELSDA